MSQTTYALEALTRPPRVSRDTRFSAATLSQSEYQEDHVRQR
jgi:hypothetical protein